MHAELILDHLGVALFPDDVQRQTLHAVEVESRTSRFAAKPGANTDSRRRLPSPLLLKLSCLFRSALAF